MLQLAERFAAVLYADDKANMSTTTDNTKPAVPVLTETLGQHASKLKADTIPLLKALQALRAADPLGAPLYSGAGSVKRDAGDGEGDDDGVGADVRAWECGREGYLNWEADRIIAKSKRNVAGTSNSATASGAAATITDAEQASDATILAEDDSKTPKRKRTAAGAGTAPTSSKRRTPGTATRSRS